MMLYSRNLLLFLALGGAALLTWVLAREPVERESAGGGDQPAARGYYLEDAELLGTNEAGEIFYRVLARRVEQQDKGDDLLFYDMSVKYQPDTEVRWDISAARGRAPADRGSLELLDAVRLEKAAGDGAEAMIFETSELTLRMNEFSAVSDQTVTLRQGQSEVTAKGLEINLETDEGRLVADASIRYRN